METCRKQAERFGDALHAAATSTRPTSPAALPLITLDREEHRARTLIIATGARPSGWGCQSEQADRPRRLGLRHLRRFFFRGKDGRGGRRRGHGLEEALPDRFASKVT